MAQRAVPNSVRGRVSATMMIVSQGAMAFGGIIWGFSGQIAGTRPTLLAAAFLLLAITAGALLLVRAPRKSLAVKDGDKAQRLAATLIRHELV